MRLTQLLEEDFVNYKTPSMFLGCISCDWKCCRERQLPISTCQNNQLSAGPVLEFSNQELYRLFIANPITQAIVLGGLEPMLQLDEVLSLISYFRERGCNAPFIIYTGYRFDELKDEIERLSVNANIIMKVGRFIPDQQPHFDDVLGVMLASNNQHGVKIS